ncbi:MAG TPA: PqqD family protein [Polyangiaceae bacterium]|jgi:hypothetical protein
MTTPPIGPDESLLPSAQVHGRRFDDEVVILDLAGGEYYALNAVGARIWEKLVGGSTPAEVARLLEAEFEVDYPRAVSDCLALADELVTRGILRRRG